MLPTHLNRTGTASIPPEVDVDQTEAVSYRLFSCFMESEVWQLSIRPLYQRMIAPLRWSDYLCIAIGVAACYAIKRVACRYQNFYARPLGILAAAASLSVAYHIVRNNINQHFNTIFQGLVRQVTVHVQAATPQDNRAQELDQLITSMSREPQFEYLGESYATILQQLRGFRNLLTQTPPNLVEIESQRTALVTSLQRP